MPALPIIIEDVVNEVDYDDVEKQKNQKPTASTSEGIQMNNEDTDTTPDSSPRSEQKSVDSGRESREDSEEEEEDGERAEEQQTAPEMTQTKVSDIVKSFEKSNKQPPPPPRPSYVPIMLNSSMRKKKQPLTTPSPTTATTPTDEPPEPAFRSRIKPPTSFTDRRSPRERKGYAVFPSDGTFNKSLPRRGKRLANANSQAPPTN